MVATEIGLTILCFVLLRFSALTHQANQTRHPLHHCYTNDECRGENLCCSYTPLLGRRNLQKYRNLDIPADGMVHYCLPYKNDNALWCVLKTQYSPNTSHYLGLCPCGPGLRCTPTEKLDPKYYPRDQYGKCTKSTT